MPPTTNVRLRDVLGLLLSIPFATAALQQPLSSNAYHHHADIIARDAATRRFNEAADSLQTSLSEHHKHRKFRDTHPEQHQQQHHNKQNTRTAPNQRALATLSPAESHDPAIRVNSAYKASAPTGGIGHARQQARSLQDWQVEDIILLATVDGGLHARDRKTGAYRWEWEADRSMVETTYHSRNRSTADDLVRLEDTIWIVEPSQDGEIYVYNPGSGLGMQKLGYTVKELAARAPYASDGQNGIPAVAYTAEKKNTLYTINAATGQILKIFSSGGSFVTEDRSCRRVNPLEPLDEEDCEPIGTLTLARTEYSILVQDMASTDFISTIRYVEWGPNNFDQDLGTQYRSTMDNKYVYTKHDGWIFGLEVGTQGKPNLNSPHKPIYRHKFGSPVARVYDIMRPYGDASSDAALVILPQPMAPIPDDLTALEEDIGESVYVNCTSDGSWYAFSEKNYPMVTDGAANTRYFIDVEFNNPTLSGTMSKKEREYFAGVHQLSPLSNNHETQLIDPPQLHSRVEPPVDDTTNRAVVPTNPPSWNSLPSVKTLIMIMALAILACGVWYQQQITPAKRFAPNQAVEDLLQGPIVPVVKDQPEVGEVPKLREAEPAEETIFPHDIPGKATDIITPDEDDDKVDVDDRAETGSPKDEEGPKQKKKATRGKRGGKKQREKDQQQAEFQAKNNLLQPPQQVEIISVAASESPQVAGPLQINSLVIHTDKLIGQGSCGTTVYEGSFEGREVAVKRMLSQFYDLASQEVSFLQQSDDHPNVVRYFCQQKDDHFLYIAVELCQASIFDVWEPEKAKTAERQIQLQTLKHSIQQDVPKALQQLAAGLYHLHNLRIIHRDIKPQNILVAFPKKHQNNGPRLVISDFGLGKNLPENVSTLVDPTGTAGTSGWKAPELISQPRETDSKHSQSTSNTGGSEGQNGTMAGVKRAADIFSLGCLFFWVLTDGTHPYEDENGWQQLRELNIKRDRKNIDALERWADGHEPLQLIEWMLQHNPQNRPTAVQVLNHPFFWSAEKRLAFLCDCSDHFEREPRGLVDDNFAGDSPALQRLESRSVEVIGTPHDFLYKLDRQFVETLGKQRKYSGWRLLDLLRALRNKRNHYEDMPEDVKRRVGPLVGGYLSYWANKFPRLLMTCYEVVHEVGVQDGDRFRGYFALGVV